MRYPSGTRGRHCPAKLINSGREEVAYEGPNLAIRHKTDLVVTAGLSNFGFDCQALDGILSAFRNLDPIGDIQDFLRDFEPLEVKPFARSRTRAHHRKPPPTPLSPAPCAPTAHHHLPTPPNADPVPARRLERRTPNSLPPRNCRPSKVSPKRSRMALKACGPHCDRC